LVASETSRFDTSSILFTDGSKGGVGNGFGVYHSGGLKSSFCLRQPSGVFISEKLTILVALIQIKAVRPSKYLIVTDSMGFLEPCRLGGLLQRLTRWYMKSRRPVGG
jgi:hypothetical protein